MIILICAVPIIVLTVESFCLTPMVLVSLVVTPVGIGYWMIDQGQGTNFSFVYIGALLCLLFGYYAAQWLFQVSACKTNGGCEIDQGRKVERVLRVLIIVVFAFVIYHLLLGGIPLLSDNPEIARFNVTSSGLFGIPSRMFLFGLPFVVLMATIAAKRALVAISRMVLISIWGFYLLASLFSGFKSSLFTAFIVFLLAQAIAGEPVSIKKIFSLQGVTVCAAILGSVFYVGSLYGTLNLDSLTGFEAYAVARSTVIAAEPGYYAITDFGTDGRWANQYLTDFRYYIDEYLPNGPQSSSDTMPLDKLISYLLYYAPIGDSDSIVSVTVGAFPEMFVNMGNIAYLGMLFLGFLFYLIYRKAMTSRSIFACGAYSSVLYWMSVYVANGNLVYYVLNMGFVIVMLYIVLVITTSVTDPMPLSGIFRGILPDLETRNDSKNA